MDGIGGLVLCMSKGFQWFLWLMYLQLPFFTLKTRSSILIGRIVVGVIIIFNIIISLICFYRLKDQFSQKYQIKEFFW